MEVVQGPSGGKDRCFFSPSGKKLRSPRGVESHLEKLGGAAANAPADAPSPEASSAVGDPAETSKADCGTVEAGAASLLFLGKMRAGGFIASKPPLDSLGEAGGSGRDAAAEDKGGSEKLGEPENLGGERTPAPHVGPGWTVEAVVRKCGRRDQHLFTPGGERLRGPAEAEGHLSPSPSIPVDGSSNIGHRDGTKMAGSTGTVLADGPSGRRSSKRAGRLSAKARQARIPGIPRSRDEGAPLVHALFFSGRGGPAPDKRNKKRQKQTGPGRTGMKGSATSEGGKPRTPNREARRMGPNRTFAEWIEELKAYKDKHGHLRVLFRENRPLHAFCGRVRNARRKPERSGTELSDDRVALLDALEFDWGPEGSVSFPERVASLRAHKVEHGHVRVRRDADKGLYEFCRRMRTARRRGKVREERASPLDALGFDWSARTRSKFEERLAALRSYREKHGHANVSRARDRSLYNFCSNVRTARQNLGDPRYMKLTEGRIASLDSIGFDWKPARSPKRDTRAKSFEGRVAALKSYKDKHGHLDVRNDEDPSLYKFCSKLRRSRSNANAKSKVNLSEERIALLDNIGFDWTPKRSTISCREKRMKQRQNNVLVGLEALKAYKVKHGHLNVSKREDRRLAAFCWGLRYSRRKSCGKLLSLPELAVQQLTRLGFDWDCVDKGLSRTADLSHSGSAGTPKKSVACKIDGRRSTCIPKGGARLMGPDRSGEIIISSDRDMAVSSSASEKVLPQQIGGGSTEQIAHTMNKAPRKRASRMNWDQHIKDLEEYRRAHGNCNVSQRNDNRSLAMFVKNMRHYKKRLDAGANIGALTQDRIEQLDGMGFQWVGLRARKTKRSVSGSEEKIAKKRKGNFLYGIEALRTYKKKHGHLNVSRMEDRRLAAFCWGLRYSRQNLCGKLLSFPESAVQQLTKLGFNWDSAGRGASQTADSLVSGSVGMAKKSATCKINGKRSICIPKCGTRLMGPGKNIEKSVESKGKYEEKHGRRLMAGKEREGLRGSRDNV